MFSMVTILPTAAWADPFSIMNIGSLCSFCDSGTLRLDHTPVGVFFFSGIQTVTTFNATGASDFDGQAIYTKNISSSPPVFSFSVSASSLGGILAEGKLDVMLTGNPNEIKFIETRKRGGLGEKLTATQMESFVFPHEETTTIPEPGTILLFGTGLIGLAGYRWAQRRRDFSHVA